jgi:hypothetical protein
VEVVATECKELQYARTNAGITIAYSTVQCL